MLPNHKSSYEISYSSQEFTAKSLEKCSIEGEQREQLNRSPQCYSSTVVRETIDRILKTALNFTDAAVKILVFLGETLEFQAGAFWSWERASNVLKCQQFWQKSPENYGEFAAITKMLTLSLGVDLPGQVWQTGETIWVEDLSANEHSPRRLHAAIEKLRGALAFPLKQGTETIGVLEFLSDRICPIDRHLLEIVEEISFRFGEGLTLHFIGRRGSQGAEWDSAHDPLACTPRQDEQCSKHSPIIFESAYLNSIELSEELQLILNSIVDGIIISDRYGDLLFFNAAAQQIFGEQLSELVSPSTINPLVVYHSDRITPFPIEKLPLLRSIKGEEISEVEVFVCREDGSQAFWLTITGKPIKDALGKLQGSITVCRNITKYKEIEQQFFHEAFHDRLTSLPNRSFLLSCIEEAIAVTKEKEQYSFALLFLDIDRFKVINDSLGHVTGDKLLVAIAQRLIKILRSRDLTARLGGDEFAIFLTDISNPDYAKQVAERIYQELMQPFNLNGNEVFVDVSIGITIGKNYERAEEVLRDADTAMHYAKGRGKSCYQVFNPTMRIHAIKLLQLENDLRWAIERQEFKLHYQPIVSLETRRITGFEALIRWYHPQKGSISPVEFIPVAEETGLIIPLGLWVLREACQQMVDWQTQYPETSSWKISVNISGKQLTKTDFVEQVQQILKETNFNPHRLKLEITESCLVENPNLVTYVLQNLQKSGIQFSLDDFGTGYSSLSYLHQFSLNTLKIDRSFIKSMDASKEKLAIVRTIVTLAWTLGMDVVAEGIEEVNQLTQLRVLKCQYGQGNFFSKPLDNQAVETLIVSELHKEDLLLEDPKVLLEEKLSQEQLLLHIENLRQELEDLKQEKEDLEILLETTTQHADIVESDLHQEISDRQKAEAALQKANQALERLTVLDSLTQVANRRRFDDYLVEQWQKLKQAKAPLSLILCDVDYFKVYNDTYGHQVGDHCLQQVALAIDCCLERADHLVARYGGEEFAVILPFTDEENAVQIGETIRLQVKNLKISHLNSPVNDYVTLSLGIYCLIPTKNSSPELLIDYADRGLYEAKERGRDRVVLKTVDLE